MAAGEKSAPPFPWADVLHTGLFLLRLDPNRLWALTPIEFWAMSGGLAPQPPRLDRERLELLMNRHPDDR